VKKDRAAAKKTDEEAKAKILSLKNDLKGRNEEIISLERKYERLDQSVDESLTAKCLKIPNLESVIEKKKGRCSTFKGNLKKLTQGKNLIKTFTQS
jgi:hypothetical protein